MIQFNEAMHEVLQQPRYDMLTGRLVNYQEIIVNAIVNFIIFLIESLFPNIGLPDGGNYNADTIITIFVIVGMLILFGIIVATLSFVMKSRAKKLVNSDISEIFDSIAKEKFSLTDLIKLSKDYASQKDFRHAARYYYIAVLVSLNDNKTLKIDKSKTNFQLKREIATVAPNLSDSFVTIVDIFQKSWFGRKPLDDIQYTNFAANVEELLSEK
ncbi:MAG: hypothetical protein FWG64_10965 [Firmicutes bacterium]|nr:hypothetical protein [Bacillota bacterium]